MDVINFDQNIKDLKASVLILGAFDGLHYGHYQLIKKARQFKLPIVITIMTNIQYISAKGSKIYSQLEVRLQQLAFWGVDKVVLVDFLKIKAIQGNLFIQKIIELTKAKHIVVGQDFAFGVNRQKNVQDLKQIFPKTIIVEKFKIKNQVVSTKLLKFLVLQGEIEVIENFSPFNFELMINLEVDHHFDWPLVLKPPSGIYATWVIFEKIRYWAVVKIIETQKSYLFCPDLIKIFQTKKCKLKIVANVKFATKNLELKIEKEDLKIAKSKLVDFFLWGNFVKLN